jgi:hypothetical protein
MLKLWAALVLLVVCAVPAAAQQGEDAQTDSDPTKPVFLSARPEFYKISDDVQRSVLIARYDAAVLKGRSLFGSKSGVIMRFELPLAHGSAFGDSATGLGDAYGQFFLLPYASRRFVWVAGSGLVIPTATDRLLGGGKWIVAPITLPVWRLSRGLFFVKVQNFISVAGDEARPDVNFLLIAPTLITAVGRGWWILVDTETKSNWKADGETGVKSGFQVGRRLKGSLGLWVKPEVWWGPNRDGDWNLKFGFILYQRPR